MLVPTAKFERIRKTPIYKAGDYLIVFLISVAVGLVCGLLSGLGIGGGSLLMLYLTLAAGTEQAAARGVNLLFFLPTAAASLLLHTKNRLVVWHTAIPAAVAGCVIGGLLSWLAAGLDSAFLRYAFGAYLLVTGCLELRHAFNRPAL